MYVRERAGYTIRTTDRMMVQIGDNKGNCNSLYFITLCCFCLTRSRLLHTRQWNNKYISNDIWVAAAAAAVQIDRKQAAAAMVWYVLIIDIYQCCCCCWLKWVNFPLSTDCFYLVRELLAVMIIKCIARASEWYTSSQSITQTPSSSSSPTVNNKLLFFVGCKNIFFCSLGWYLKNTMRTERLGIKFCVFPKNSAMRIADGAAVNEKKISNIFWPLFL